LGAGTTIAKEGEDVNATWFEEAYMGTPPWDIGRHQPAFERLADAGAIAVPVLDAGCGTGENALFLAARGLEVVGVDAVPAAVEAARDKARSRGLTVEFVVHDALSLDELGRTFATVIDSGLFHTFDDEERVRYARALAAVLRPGGLYHVLCFSEHEKGSGGPRRVTQAELYDTFDRAPFRVLSIEAERFVANGGPGRQAWLATVQRTAAGVAPD
jgi:SAM-dependent methyltransferase